MSRPYLALGALTVGEQLILDQLKSAPAPLTAQQIAEATGLTQLSGIKDKLHVLTLAGLAEEHGLPGPTATYSAL